MTKSSSLIFLIRSMSKSEKRIFRTGRKESDYVALFDIICDKGVISSDELKKMYEKQIGKASFNVAVSYLYDELLNVLLSLRRDQDSSYRLFDSIMKARVLFEKALYDDALQLLGTIKKEAVRFENHLALLYASRLELEFLLFLDIPDISESELVGKHFRIDEVLKKIRTIYEQSSLYELLVHRIIYKGDVRSREEQEKMNDLVFAEMSLSSASKNSFEAKKLHQMFQSNYLMGIGDRKSAYQSFRELNRLFEDNPMFWANPPFYYVSVLEGILDNLRSMKYYDKMPYFIERLKKIESPSVRFQTDVATLVFMYELFPLLDTGDFIGAKRHLECHNDSILSKKDQMNPFRRAELSLYTAIVHLGLGEYKKARKMLVNELFLDNKLYTFPIHRIMRLVNLIIHYELNDSEYVHRESRSVRREILKTGKVYRVESLVFDFLNNDKFRPPAKLKRGAAGAKLKADISDIRSDIFESQLFRYFDFTAWIESKIDRIPLSEVLRCRYAIPDDTSATKKAVQ